MLNRNTWQKLCMSVAEDCGWSSDRPDVCHYHRYQRWNTLSPSWIMSPPNLLPPKRTINNSTETEPKHISAITYSFRYVLWLGCYYCVCVAFRVVLSTVGSFMGRTKMCKVSLSEWVLFICKRGRIGESLKGKPRLMIKRKRKITMSINIEKRNIRL